MAEGDKVFRVNYGVIFNRIGVFDTVYDHWTHTFQRQVLTFDLNPFNHNVSELLANDKQEDLNSKNVIEAAQQSATIYEKAVDSILATMPVSVMSVGLLQSAF